MSRLVLVAALWLSMVCVASAQSMPEMHDMDHGAHAESPPTTPESPAPETGMHSPHDAHAPASDDHAAAADEAVGNEPAPEPPGDHAADGVFDPAAMQRAREQLRREHGRSLISKVMLNLGEYRVQDEGDQGYRWEGEARIGGNIHRLVLKSEGEGVVSAGLDSAELQALYSRAITPFYDLQAGLRQDFEPTTRRTYATLGFEGLAPYWFLTQGALFVSDRGDVLARLEGTYDIRLFQRLVLQPQLEINLAAQNVPEAEIGAGLSSLELGLRLRYEWRREFAPYVGFSYDRVFGETADLARAAGDGSSDYGFVAGLRAWF